MHVSQTYAYVWVSALDTRLAAYLHVWVNALSTVFSRGLSLRVRLGQHPRYVPRSLLVLLGSTLGTVVSRGSPEHATVVGTGEFFHILIPVGALMTCVCLYCPAGALIFLLRKKGEGPL